ncbi:hypothetical protein BQ8794_180118 [Mesorhizobium prunaredense]|uniref:Uncharacterized protein n=1 Tax=Mesorhizobium prunaredense TaxID=1631249 RepID=A0A1R3V4D5_9HYPH|nr:hypothetical protein BQ8794_180118 [Mesorhizobium prunaredense]
MIHNCFYLDCAAIVLVEQMDVVSVDTHLPGLMHHLCAEPGRAPDKEVKSIAAAATGPVKENTQTLPFGSAKAL